MATAAAITVRKVDPVYGVFGNETGRYVATLSCGHQSLGDRKSLHAFYFGKVLMCSFCLYTREP